VLKDAGSTPRKAGTKAIVLADGAIVGTVGGGAVEAQTQRLAAEAIRSGRPVVFDFVMEGERAAGTEPICGGSMRILIDPAPIAGRDSYAQAAEARRQRRRGLLLTEVRFAPDPRVAMRWLAAEAIGSGMSIDEAALPGADDLRAALEGGAPRHFAREPSQGVEAAEVLVEPVLPAPLLVIVGGGHVGQALAALGRFAGFDILVLDDRAEFAAGALFPPGTALRCGDIAKELSALPLGGDAYVVVVTRGHQHDQAALAACIRKPAAYIGMIGSKRKVALIGKNLLDSGLASEEELGRLHAPIGLAIGAQTVPEIAVSIVAELVSVLRKGEGGGGSLSARGGTQL
jgi:xanthine dehydrogenase accessory factor